MLQSSQSHTQYSYIYKVDISIGLILDQDLYCEEAQFIYHASSLKVSLLSLKCNEGKSQALKMTVLHFTILQ